jgi:hypothetical protein
MMQYVSIVMLVAQYTIGLFWLSQIIRVLLTDIELFEDHKHKLLWFLAIVFVPVVGAVWFSVWRHQETSKRAIRQADQNVERIAEAFQAESHT